MTPLLSDDFSGGGWPARGGAVAAGNCLAYFLKKKLLFLLDFLPSTHFFTQNSQIVTTTA